MLVLSIILWWNVSCQYYYYGMSVVKNVIVECQLSIVECYIVNNIIAMPVVIYFGRSVVNCRMLYCQQCQLSYLGRSVVNCRMLLVICGMSVHQLSLLSDIS